LRQWWKGIRDLAQRARAGRAASPVFIVGEARSGTSILFRSLLAHPAFAIRDVNLVESFFVQRLVEHATVERGIAPELEEYLLDDRVRFDQFAAALRTVGPWRAATLPVIRRRPVVPLFRLSLTGVALRAYVDVATEARGCNRLVEKTPHNVPYAENLLAAFPHGRMLYVVRHPVDTLSSYRRRSRTEPDATWTALSADDFCRRWETTAPLALRHARRHESSFLIVRYEDFTRVPKDVFADVCAFVGEPFVAEALTADPEGYGSWEVDPHLFGPIVNDTKTWQEYLSAAEASSVEDRLAETMRAFGYERYT
jgi:hypothetical protein